MARASEIINKVLGAGMSLASMGFFVEAFSGSFAHVGAVIPGLLFGAGGFWLIARRESAAALEPQVQQRMERLADAVTTVQNELNAMQDKVERLSDEHDFMRQLAAPAGPAASRIPLAADPAKAPAPQADIGQSS